MNPIGIMLNNLEKDRLRAFGVAVREKFTVVHTNAVFEHFLTDPERGQYIAAARESGLTIDTMFIGFDGQSYADIDAISRTVGILPIPDLREHRIQVALLYCDLARDLGVKSLAMHLGFFPKDTTDADYRYLVNAIRTIADRCGEYGQTLNFETGQESGAELLEFIEEVDRPNLGVNFDCGNFLLYGTDDPLIALQTLRDHIRGVHCKDGHRPTTPGQLGKETPLGQGEMDFPAFLGELKKMGYSGPLIIEREAGPKVLEDVQAGVAYLQQVRSEI